MSRRFPSVVARRQGDTGMGSRSGGSRVGLVGCVKTKRAVASTAKDLYVSTLFHGQRRAVEASCARWFILSAKHGLLSPDTVIEPYEETLKNTPARCKRTWSRRVLGQLRHELGELDDVHFEIHAGQDYYAYGLVEGLSDAGATIELPTEGLSMGQKLSYYGDGRPDGPRRPQTPDASSGCGRRTPPPDVPVPRGKYRPLYEYLEALGDDRWDAWFTEVEDVLGVRLPESARNHLAWWANETATHTHARAWIAAGFHTTNVNLPDERVSFVRIRS